MMTKQRRARGSGGISKRANGLWVGSVTLPSTDGVQRRKYVSSRDHGTAVRKLRELQAMVDAGEVSGDPAMKVGVWLDYWLENVRGPSVRPKTKAFYANAIQHHIKPAIGGKKLDALKPAHVRAMLESIDSTRTRQCAHIVLRLALKSAVIERLIRFNVTDAIPRPRHLTKALGAFDTKTAAHIIDTALRTRELSEATRWAAAFLTGARQGELLGLQWSHVNLDDGFIELAWQLQQLRQEHGCGEAITDPSTVIASSQKLYPCKRIKPGFCPQRRWVVSDGFDFVPLHGSLALTRPKSSAGMRVVPLVAPLAAALTNLKAITPANSYDLVWTNVDGHPIQPRADHRAWQALLKDANIAAAPLHAARHTTATLLLEAGVDEDTRMRITGHSSATAHRGYVHVSQDRARAALEQLSALMPELMK